MSRSRRPIPYFDPAIETLRAALDFDDAARLETARGIVRAPPCATSQVRMRTSARSVDSSVRDRASCPRPPPGELHRPRARQRQERARARWRHDPVSRRRHRFRSCRTGRSSQADALNRTQTAAAVSVRPEPGGPVSATRGRLPARGDHRASSCSIGAARVVASASMCDASAGSAHSIASESDREALAQSPLIQRLTQASAMCTLRLRSRHSSRECSAQAFARVMCRRVPMLARPRASQPHQRGAERPDLPSAASV